MKQLSPYIVAISLFLFACASPPQRTQQVRRVAPPPPPAPTATANVREISRITHDPAPEFAPRTSPNGDSLLFWVVDHTKGAGQKLSIVSVSLQQAGRKLIAGPGAWFPAWFPDGKNFVYAYNKMKSPILVRSPFGGVGMTFITPSPMGTEDGQPHVSPDGQKIAFYTRIGGTANVCTVNVNGTNFTVYVEGASPRWHPSANLIAFDNSIGQQAHIFLLDLDSGQVTQLTSGSSLNGFPVWSPDGKWLAFTSNRDGKYHLYAMKNDGSALTQLTKGEAEEYFPEWSSDGFVYFSCNAGAPAATGSNPWGWKYANIWRLKPVLPE